MCRDYIANYIKTKLTNRCVKMRIRNKKIFTVLKPCSVLFLIITWSIIISWNTDWNFICHEADDSNQQLKTSKPKPKHFFVILIPSEPKDILLRHYYRSQYLNMSAWRSKEYKDIGKEFLRFKIMFIVGKNENDTSPRGLFLEMTNHNDIFYKEKIIESREMLRYKILWGMRKSLEESEYSYLVKVDQDTLVDLPHLTRGLTALSRREVYTGVCHRNLLYRVEEFRLPQYKGVPYCQGGAYILSRDVIQMITEIDSHSPDYFIRPEDGYVGWLVKQARLKYNITTFLPQMSRGIMEHNFHPMINKYIEFKWWFYHNLKMVKRLNPVFKCRIMLDEEQCPTKNYTISITDHTCQCITQHNATSLDFLTIGSVN